MSMTEAVMAFGKHAGMPISKLPSGYLWWLATKAEHIKEPMKSAILAEHNKRLESMWIDDDFDLWPQEF